MGFGKSFNHAGLSCVCRCSISLHNFRALRHLLGKNLINSILKNLDLLWKRITKERRFPISSPCTDNDGEPQFGMASVFTLRNGRYPRSFFSSALCASRGTFQMFPRLLSSVLVMRVLFSLTSCHFGRDTFGSQACLKSGATTTCL